MVIEFEDLKVHIEVTERPRPAPATRNPDDPGFGDPGDDGEFIIQTIEIYDNGGFIVIDDGWTFDLIANRLYESNKFHRKAWDKYRRLYG